MALRTLVTLSLSMLLSGCEIGMLADVAAGCASRPELALLPEELPVAQVGVPYSARIEVVHASSPVSGIYVSPSQPLPDGLTLEHVRRKSHGVIRGTPLAPGVHEVLMYTSTYGTQCTGKSVERLYRLEVAAKN